MKRFILFTLMLAILLPSLAIAASGDTQPIRQERLQAQQTQVQQPQPVQRQPQAVQPRAQELAVQERELVLQQRQAELNFQREKQNIELERMRLELKSIDKSPKEGLKALLLVAMVVHILCAVWVYQDIRKLNTISGLWIVIALLTGLLGTLVYAVVRLGEKSKPQLNQQ
jgi:hypothetical protein